MHLDVANPYTLHKLAPFITPSSTLIGVLSLARSYSDRQQARASPFCVRPRLSNDPPLLPHIELCSFVRSRKHIFIKTFYFELAITFTVTFYFSTSMRPLGGDSAHFDSLETNTWRVILAVDEVSQSELAAVDFAGIFALVEHFQWGFAPVTFASRSPIRLQLHAALNFSRTRATFRQSSSSSPTHVVFKPLLIWYFIAHDYAAPMEPTFNKFFPSL